MTRTFVMGDPQGPFAKVIEILSLHGALVGDRLAPDVVLVSIGDHFDYDAKHPHEAGREGLVLLRWLASHEPSQVVLMLGNHDASRVMELATITEDEFERARVLASSDEAAYVAEFPQLPPPGVIGRDYASFSPEQRALVMQLLLAGRFRLALTGTLCDGRSVLLTHAGVTTRELKMLGIAAATPATIAAGLEHLLVAAIDRVRDDWQRGELAPLSLEPLHVVGVPGAEGGGLLYHRPSNPDREGPDRAWAFAPSRPRRFDPRTLPLGLTQIAGHSGHAKCVEELGEWVTPEARARKHGGLRTLRLSSSGVSYDLGIAMPAPGVADLILIDGEMRRVPADDVSLLELAQLD